MQRKNSLAEIKLVLLGAGDFAQEVADLASEIPGVKVCGFVEGRNKKRCADKILGVPILWIDELSKLDQGFVAICGTGQEGRSRFIEQARARGMRFTTLVHPEAHISKTSSIGEGSVVLPGAVIGAQTKIGRHAILNRACSIGHHVEIGDYVSISPGANIASKAHIGQYTTIGMGSNIIGGGLRIGSNVVVGAGAVVLEDISDSTMVFGVPARLVQRRPCLGATGGTIESMLFSAATRCADSRAIITLGGDSVSYAELYRRVTHVRTTLRALGIGRKDKVALLLPNGPEMAVAFLAVSSCAVAVPLNPDYRKSELELYFSDVGVSAVIVDGNGQPAVESAAAKLGVNLIRLVPMDEAGVGAFNLIGDPERNAVTQESEAHSQDVALILHTSGTTSRPKQVPLTHGNVCGSAENTRSTLDLSSEDICLNVMPLFHIHGLVGALLASVAAAASIVCTAGFNGPNFLEWLRKTQASWYTAVPTIHHSVVSEIERNPRANLEHDLRVIRSSSSALPPRVAETLENAFGVPVIEAYGMTEASHQMTSSPLPPKPRKVGSAGIAAGPDVAVMDESGFLLPVGEIGEIVIKGSNVTLGYIGKPELNEQAFTNGWFRTGDEGYLDTDGYLFIRGRIKEVINRGGEKISPREVDEALMDHPAVTQAFAFAFADERLGQNVAAVAVLKPSLSVSERSLREFLSERLAHFKVPTRILFVDEIPKGPTGKLKRTGLADHLGLVVKEKAVRKSVVMVKPRSHAEKVLVDIWKQLLKVDALSVEDAFVDLGGDSLLATLLISKVEQEFGVALSMLDMTDASTIAEQAIIVDRLLAPRKTGFETEG